MYRINRCKSRFSGKLSDDHRIHSRIQLLDQTSCNDRQNKKQQRLSDIVFRQTAFFHLRFPYLLLRMNKQQPRIVNLRCVVLPKP